MSGDGYLRKARTAVPSPAPTESTEPMTFSERLASVRNQEVERAQRKDIVAKSRTTAFGIGQHEIEKFKSEAVDLPPELTQTPAYSREDILGRPKSAAAAAGLTRSNTAPSLRSPKKFADARAAAAAAKAEENAASFEAYSGFHLSRRIIPHNVLTRNLSGKAIYGLKELLRDVKAPEWDLPDVEQDVVVMGIVAKKSEPRLHKQGIQRKNSDEPRKYMVMTVVDLKWEVDMFLFNTGFDRFWKLTEGTVIALLNPTIMPPRKGTEATGKFTLCLNSDEDTVIEIGHARDLGFCQSKKKDGQLCMTWTNKKRTQFCEYHTNEAVNKQRGSRIEMNGSSFGGRKNRSHEIRDWAARKKKEELSRRDGQYDRDTSTRYFMSRTMSAADLIDGKDRTQVDKKERAEYMKRQLEAKERENEIKARLSRTGGGAGREYMKASASRSAAADGTSQTDPHNHAAARAAKLRQNGLSVDGRCSALPPSSSITLGLSQEATGSPPRIGPRSREQAIQLGPLKRKRADSSLSGLSTTSRFRTTPSATSTSSTPSGGALGWGGNLKSKLSRMKEGEKLRKEEERRAVVQKKGSLSPVRKKTRFVTDKGIREAGRESLGTELAGRQLLAFDDDDDDDELLIV